MIVKLTDKIWWGDKPSVQESLGEVQSVLNVAHKIRRPYWGDLKNLDWEVWYFRLACPDRVEPDQNYLRALFSVLTAIGDAGKFPLLCHCRAGGHRGPTAAIFAAWFLDSDKRSAEYWLKLAESRREGVSKISRHRVYRRVLFEHMSQFDKEEEQ